MNLKTVVSKQLAKLKTIHPVKFKQFWPLLLLLIPLAIYLGYGFWQLKLPIERWDEFTNISVVRESLASAQPLNLVYQQQPFLEKPPLWYFLSMIPVRILGDRTIAFRIISIISGISILGIVFLFVNRRYDRKAGLFATISLLSFAELFVRNAGGYFDTHTLFSADLDGLFLAFLIAGCIFLAASGFRKNLMGILLLALAYLVKGPLAVVIFTLVVGYRFITKQIMLRPALFLLASFVILLLPWHIVMFVIHGQGFLAAYFNSSLLQRAILPIEGHNQSWYFYFELLVNPAVNPVGIVQIGLFVFSISRQVIAKKVTLFSTIILAILLLITLMQTRITWYLLAVYPFLAMELGRIYYELTGITDHAKLIQVLLWILTVSAIIINFLAIIGS
jgi:4-amino-4-deoxy-L-arabinose transferase-like glycosyltransferase